MRMYGGADTKGLVATGNWRDPRSASRYEHVVSRAPNGTASRSLPALGTSGEKPVND
jgi:hypothetical protein